MCVCMAITCACVFTPLTITCVCVCVCYLHCSYAATFEENRIGKGMLLDLDKVCKLCTHFLDI